MVEGVMGMLRFLLAALGAALTGALVSRLKLPSILGWLIGGMVLGPHALGVLDQNILDAGWYQGMTHVLECAVGLMIGTELVWKKLKTAGKAIVITTLTQSLGTFFVVSAVFGSVFYFMDIPVYLGLVFGGIALATAPAPALSIVKEFKARGPVTATLLPMAALDDIVGCIVFFTTISVLAGVLSADSLPVWVIPFMVVGPLIIGACTGFLTGWIMKREENPRRCFAWMTAGILLSSAFGLLVNELVLASPVLNFLLTGMAYSAVFANMIGEEKLEKMMKMFSPVMTLAMIAVIVNLGAPLDYHLIFGAGVFTVIYILTRAFGKYMGAYVGASVTKSPETVKKYLGLTLLPHSGVSLVFTGIAVSVLQAPAPECAGIVQGTIAAAAVINEIIAVLAAKKGFEMAGELNQGQQGKGQAG